MTDSILQQTGALFGDLWHRYDDKLFAESVMLFAMRFQANGFDLNWFQDKRVLDVGCGSGRYTIAMAELGAAVAVGCDISKTGLENALVRAAHLPQVRFQTASALHLPYEDASFDFVCCSGVLHHTSDAERGAREIYRVLKKQGKVYLLLYGTGGLRWPTIMVLRPYAHRIGYEQVDQVMRRMGLPANKQRTFLDDLFVPLIDFYDWERFRRMLESTGFTQLERWTEGKLDHESSVATQRAELQQLDDLFDGALQMDDARVQSAREDWAAARNAVRSSLAVLDAAAADFEAGKIDQPTRDQIIFGWGHHRVLALKG